MTVLIGRADIRKLGLHSIFKFVNCVSNVDLWPIKLIEPGYEHSATWLCITTVNKSYKNMLLLAKCKYHIFKDLENLTQIV